MPELLFFPYSDIDSQNGLQWCNNLSTLVSLCRKLGSYILLLWFHCQSDERINLLIHVKYIL